MTGVGALPVPRPTAVWRRGLPAAVLLVAVAAGTAAAGSPRWAVVAAAGAVVFGSVLWRPAVAGYLVVGVTPLIVGIDRDRVVPVLRPNEVLLGVVGSALLTRTALTRRRGDPLLPRVGLVPVSMALMATCNSVVILTWMALRGQHITSDDLSYAMVLWKYLAIYVVVRASVRTESDVGRCLWLAMAAAAVVSVIAVLQSLELFGVPHLLSTYYAPFGNTTALEIKRGSSLLSLPAATADLMVFNLAIVVGLWQRIRRYRPALLLLAALFVTGTIASGQFSAAIGLVVALAAVSLVSGRRDVPIALGVGALASAIPLWPVIRNRLSGFSGGAGMPESWVGRLHNLRTYFWPQLFSRGDFLLGVRPAARVPGPRELGIQWVWIESGYTWLLWGGGVPLLLSFLLFVATTIRRSWRVARTHVAASGAAATAVFVGVCVVTVLMVFDPHVTYRGSADLLFSLIALMAVADDHRRTGTGR